jgi:hypothetical protein
VTVETVIAIGAGAGVAIMAMATTIILVLNAKKPWSLLADERLRRAKAEADRDVARIAEGRIATMSMQKDKTIDEQKHQIADLQARLRLRPGHGSELLQDQLEAEGAGGDEAADLGGGAGGAVPRVTGPGAFPVDPNLRR